MKIYITKKALTKGIQEREIEDFRIKHTKSSLTIYHQTYKIPIEWYSKPDWHLTRMEAVNQADIMRGKAIDACKRKIVRLQQLKFIK